MWTIWRHEKLAILLTLGAMALLGIFYHDLALATGLPLACYLGWMYSRLLRLEHWLERGAKPGEVFDDRGLIGQVVRHIYYQKKAHIKRKKRTKRLLHRLNENISALPDATVLLNEHYEIVWFNDAATYLLQLKLSDRGNRIDNLLRQPDFQHYLFNPQGLRHLEIASPVTPQETLQLKIVCFGDNQHLLIARNISDQKQMQQALKGFVANASHELQTPLTSIIGYLEILEMEQGLSDIGQQSLQVIEQQAKRMQGLIQDLLQLSRIESHSLQPDEGEWIDMDELLNGLIAGLSSHPGHERIICDIQPGLKLLGVRNDIQSLCSNLLENALKHCPADTQIKLGWQQNAQAELVFCVNDQGNGINKADIPRLTQRYFRGSNTTSEQVAGSGLGLSIVQQAAQKHGAKLDIKSVKGKGSRFCVIFPNYRNQANAGQHQHGLNAE